MSKIKSIEIADFRAYRDKQTFTFEKNGGIANLMVLYAPNGYGKTSFFDAIEWCFSGKIARFESSILGPEVDKRTFAEGDQILLTNRQSFKKNNRTKGLVKITTADDQMIDRKTDPRQITGRPGKKYDYRPGTLATVFEASTLASLVTTNILTQDMIDTFLRYQSPEDKFKGLIEFWPEGLNATTTYKYLTNYERVLRNEKSVLESRIAETEKQIASLLNSDENISRVNERITELKKNSLADFQLEPIDNTVSEQLYDNIREAGQTYTKKAAQLLETAQRKLAALQQLLADLPNFLNQNQTLGSHKARYEQVSNLERSLTESRALGTRIKESEAKLTTDDDAFTLLTRYLAGYDDHKKIAEQIALLEKENQTLLNQNDRLLGHNQIHLRSRDVLETSLKQTKEETADLTDLISNITDYVVQYSYWQQETNKANGIITEADRVIEQADDELAAIAGRFRFLNELGRDGFYRTVNSPDIVELNKSISLWSKLDGERRTIDKKIAAFRTELERTGSFEENLDRILTWGAEYVRELEETSCPLCKTEFGDFSVLLARVAAEKTEVLKMARLRENLHSHELEKEKLKKALASEESSILFLKQQEEQSCRKAEEPLTLRRQQENIRRQDAIQARDHSITQANEFMAKMKKRITSASNLLQPALEELIASMKSELRSLENKVQRLEQLIRKKQELVDDHTFQIQSNQQQTGQQENQVKLLKSDEKYNEFRGLLKEIPLAHRDLVPGSVADTLIAELRSGMEKERGQLQKLTERRLAVAAELEKMEIKLAEENILREKLAEEERMQQTNTTILQFIARYRELAGDDQIEATALLKKITEQEEYLAQITTELQSLEDFEILLAVINENVTKTKQTPVKQNGT
jgi:DNA repair exonuclease SbcCD ATPase subunit